MVVRVLPLAILLLALASPVAAAPDWQASGGAIFAAPSAPDATAPPEAPAEVRLPPSTQPFDAAVVSAAQRHGLDPKLLHAVVAVESAYRVRAVSTAGAGGLTQLMPATAVDLGVSDRFEPEQALGAGASYLARQLLRFGDLRLALAAYNSGPERVARAGGIPRIAETQAYVVAVVDCYLALSAGRAIRTSRDCRAAAP